MRCAREVEAYRESRAASQWERRPAALGPGAQPQRSRSPRHRIAAGRRSHEGLSSSGVADSRSMDVSRTRVTQTRGPPAKASTSGCLAAGTLIKGPADALEAKAEALDSSRAPSAETLSTAEFTAASSRPEAAPTGHTGNAITP